MSLSNIKVNNQQIIGIDSQITSNSNNLVTTNAILDKLKMYYSSFSTTDAYWNWVFTNLNIEKDCCFLLIISTDKQWTRFVVGFNDYYGNLLFDTNEYNEKLIITLQARLLTTSIGFYFNVVEQTNVNIEMTILNSLDSEFKNFMVQTNQIIENGIISNNIWEQNGEYQPHSYLTQEQRKNVYFSIINARFKNCDKTKKRSIWFIWNISEQNKLEIGISVYDNNTWSQEFRQKFDINFSTDKYVSLHFTNNSKELDLLYDVSYYYKIESTYTGALLNNFSEIPEFIFSLICYEDNISQPVEDTTIIQKTIRLYPNTKLPVFSFEFDDACINDYVFYNLFQSYGVTCGFALIASESFINNRTEEYLKYQADGFSILNHSVDGTIFNTINYNYTTAQNAIETAQRRLEKAGFIVNGFASPSSHMDAEFIPIIKKHFAYASTYQDSAQNGRNANPCLTTRMGVFSETLPNIKNYIDSQIEADKITTFYGHGHDLNETNTLERIASVIEYILEKQALGLCKLMSPDNARAYYFDL